jgi:serine/threonine-protein kinase
MGEAAERGLAAQGAADGGTLGRYRLLFRIAAGGMAEVYVGAQRGERGFRKLVAIKRMLPHLGTDEHFVQMFLDEARIAADINSPHVVPTLDLGVDENDAPFLVMELIVGLSLAQLLRSVFARSERIPTPIALELLAQAADGLHDAHEARSATGVPLGIVHRDISPQNVLIGTDGRARITDFGVARALNRLTRTNTGELKGKFAYFSPEQANAAELDARADVFALGVVAWETFAAARLFATDNPLTTLEAVRGKAIPRLDAAPYGCSRAVADAVAGALERDLSKRFTSAAEFSRALRTAMEGTRTERSELETWLQGVERPRLDALRARIEGAIAGFEQELTPSVSASGRASGPGGRPSVSGVRAGEPEPANEPAPRDETSAVRTSVAAHRAAVAQEAPAEARGISPKLALAALALCGVVGLAVGGWFLSRNAHEAPPTAAVSDAATTPSAPQTPTAETPPPETTTADTTASPTATDATGAQAAQADTPTAEAPPAYPATEILVPREEDPPRARTRRRGATDAAREAPAASPTAAPPPATTATTAPAADTTTRRGALRGMDNFERELAHP